MKSLVWLLLGLLIVIVLALSLAGDPEAFCPKDLATICLFT